MWFLRPGVLILIGISFAVAQPPGGRRPGGFVPGQKRAAEDPAAVTRGKTIYGVSCAGCHGSDLRGGDMGGPNLLRSQVALSDRDGDLIIPIIMGARKDAGMPAIPMKDEDAKAVSAYIRSVVGMIGVQGRPPETGKEAPSILIGNAAAGAKYFASKCGGCHSATGDLKGIATRIKDEKMLQNDWIAGGGGGGRRGPGGGLAPNRTPDVHVTMPSGETVDGKLFRIDDFLVSVMLPDGTTRTIRREGDVPRVDMKDPMKAHKDMLPVYTDKDIHDVTAYLVTLK